MKRRMHSLSVCSGVLSGVDNSVRDRNEPSGTTYASWSDNGQKTGTFGCGSIISSASTIKPSSMWSFYGCLQFGLRGHLRELSGKHGYCDSTHTSGYAHKYECNYCPGHK